MEIKQVEQWLSLFTEKINQNKVYLSDLDSAIGDGDHGNNMARGTGEMLKAIEGQEFANLGDLFKLVGMTLISKVGGASGPLYGSAFISMSQAAQASTELVPILTAGLAGIQKRGKAEVGDKTMVDMWAGVIKALAEGTLTAEKIEAIGESTKDIQARKGRASYLGERSIGHLDPGTISSGFLFEGMLEAGVTA